MRYKTIEIQSRPRTPKQIKTCLKLLEARWNPNYWIFVENGTLHLMQKRKGERVHTDRGSVNMGYSVASFPDIDADGGAV